jgi:hypothetical protein
MLRGEMLQMHPWDDVMALRGVHRFIAEVAALARKPRTGNLQELHIRKVLKFFLNQ